ncbi:MAG: alpha-mannosidase, partial [Candidatus Dormiibacterota bacterium]
DRIGVKHLRHDAVQVPADWPLEQVRLHLSLGGEGLVEVVYDEGESEGFGLDPNHRRYPLHAREFAIDAEVVGRLPFGQPVRDPHLEAAALVVEEPDLSRLLALLSAVQSAAGALLEEEVADPLLGAAEHALTLLDWPSDTLPYVARTAGTPQQQAIWELPADLPSSPAPLDEQARASVRAAIADLEKGLAKLRERYPKHGRVLLSGHAHLDLAWLWPLAETRRKARRTSSTVLALLDRYPEFVFNQSSAQVYAYLEEDDPELWAAVKQEVEGGRWEPVGGMWIEPDCNLPSGEALARQLLYGQRYFERAFGHRHRVAWLPDCFGFTGGLPQLLRQAGITGFFTIKVNWSETNHFPYDLFWWEGIDGTRVLAHTFENPGGGYNGDASPASFVGTWDNYRGKHVHPESLLSVGFGDGAGGPTREMMASVDVSEQLPVVPAASFGLVEELFQRFGEAAERNSLPVWVGNLYLELHRGTLTTQGRTKLLHRRGERTLLAAEALGSLATLAGASLPPSLEPAWRILLRNEFHDILPGSGIREVYQDAEAELSQVVEVAEAARATAVDAIAGQLATDGGAPAVVALN